VAATLVTLAVAVLLATGFVGAGRLEPSTFPLAWAAARRTVDQDSCRIAVLGDGAYTDPGFTGSRIVANPAGGYFGDRAVVSVDTGLAGLEQRAPRNRAEAWLAAVNDPYLRGHTLRPDVAGAARAGVGWIFVDRPIDRPEVGQALDANGFVPSGVNDRAGVWRVPGGCR
jgi:hypothetical protein